MEAADPSAVAAALIEEVSRLKRSDTQVREDVSQHADLIHEHTRNRTEITDKVNEIHRTYDAKLTAMDRQLEIASAGYKGSRNIAESTIPMGIPMLESKREHWREWVAKIITSVDQFRPGARDVLETIVKKTEIVEYN